MTPKEPPKVLDRFLLLLFVFFCFFRVLYLFYIFVHNNLFCVSTWNKEFNNKNMFILWCIIWCLYICTLIIQWKKRNKKNIINIKTLNDVFERKHCRVGSSVMLQRSSPRTLTIYNEISFNFIYNFCFC